MQLIRLRDSAYKVSREEWRKEKRERERIHSSAILGKGEDVFWKFKLSFNFS